MKSLTDYAKSAGFKLTKPQSNLLAKLEAAAVRVNENRVTLGATGADVIVTQNLVSGYRAPLNPLISTLVEWVYTMTLKYERQMSFAGLGFTNAEYDRVRYTILAWDSEAYSNFID